MNMTNLTSQTIASAMPMRATPHTLIVGLIGFLTLVDLFAAQAILPSLTAHYGVSPAAMGFAVNACTIGMAASGLLVSLVAGRIDRRRGVWVSLTLLSLPTVALAFAPDLTIFTLLRVAQGICMAAAFTLTMTYLSERARPQDTAAALAAYVTGVVAANLVGRLISGSVADLFGLAANFYVFAGLNLAGALLVGLTLLPTPKTGPGCAMGHAALDAWKAHFANPALRAAFGLGFLILFVFIGVFTYVNFELVRPPLALSPMDLGFVYLVFLPAMLTTPIAGRVAARWGIRRSLFAAFGLCIVAAPLLVLHDLALVLAGLAAIGVGTFFAQAIATGFVGRAARTDRAAASGLYLSSYYLGGMAGAAVLGQVYDGLGWQVTVGAITLALILALALGSRLVLPSDSGVRP